MTDRHKNGGGELNRLWVPNPPLFILDIQRQCGYNQRLKTCTYSFPLKKTAYDLYHKIEWQHKHGQYSSRVNGC